MQSWIIYDEYPPHHPIFRLKCPVCDKQFKIGDEVLQLPIQKSKSGKSINATALTIHTNCYWVD